LMSIVSLVIAPTLAQIGEKRSSPTTLNKPIELIKIDKTPARAAALLKDNTALMR